MTRTGTRKYPLRRNRLLRGCCKGFTVDDTGALIGDETTIHRHFFLPMLDSATDDCPWGRLTFHKRLDADMALTIHLFASNDRFFVQNGTLAEVDAFLLDSKVAVAHKSLLFQQADALLTLGANDVLLYGQTGRYLWLWIELIGTGTAELTDFRIYAPGDSFYQTFPEVYQTEGDFLHRYLSIFSSLYNDLQERIDHLDDYLCIETAPPQALYMMADWLGLEGCETVLSHAEVRTVLRHAHALIYSKGTKQSIQQAAELFVQEPVYIVERNQMEQGTEVNALYGGSPFDFTVLINRKADEQLRMKLQFLIDQLKPIRSRANIVFIGDCAGLDAFTYFDINGTVLEGGVGNLDDGKALTGMTYLK